MAAGKSVLHGSTPIKKTRIGRCGFFWFLGVWWTSPSRRPASAAHDYSRAECCGWRYRDWRGE
ncbi:hypothetical protein CPA10_07615 [Xanthomonas citri pv. citri]|nr:hypothetical protein CLM98_08075 [Xanthomonas citri pv. citri]AYL20254.1 hypothetical protein COR42_07620 [Xanthomonas citri pv. citri]AYL24689.1 hypothetical protein CPA10_07615 [Xanthomonas citri pv. citri]